MKRFILFFFISLLTSVSIFAQDNKIDEFSDLDCENVLAKSDFFASLLEKSPNSRLYLIFYEGKHLQHYYNQKNKKFEYRWINPRKGEAKIKIKAITLYLEKYRKLDSDRFELIDAGIDSHYKVEVYLVSEAMSFPKILSDSSKSKNEKTKIKFRTGKPKKVVDCQKYYDSI